MEELISVIVPVYNVEKYLERCILSLLQQTYEKLEIILVDDGSKDSSGQICDKYVELDHRIQVIHQQNMGLSGARNSGIEAAKGKYFAFVDADDYIHPEMYAVLINVMEIKNAQIAICDFQKVYNEDGTIFEAHTQEEIVIYEKKEALKELNGGLAQRFVVAWNKLYKKELFETLRYPLKKINEDEFLTYKVFDQANRIAWLSNPMYYYFQNNQSITTNSGYLLSQDLFEALEERSNYYLEKGYEDLAKETQEYYLVRLIMRYQQLKKSEVVSKEQLKKMRGKFKEYYKSHRNREFKWAVKAFYLNTTVYTAAHFVEKVKSKWKKIGIK